MNSESLSLSWGRIRSLAIDTFSSEAKADAWLNKPHTILGNTPIATAESSYGYAEVERMLHAIGFGGTV
ncbi:MULTISPECIES: MbcA/ParS/Xre antitoxin family protein [unclassified Methylophilus]|uniref:MbcA/ParS/Xre antitoxin family protein n=1 Tax=unclassified Methylophilus TaxID=2630143 RepID=UPI0006F237F6|nr:MULTISPECIES: MbcA/ParS/Xre antitoxin family protein [unclassified Methylophilus]KQT42614.1 hypothetical protein ASG34_07770 [Methylophilus sp. Leaf416]KQT56799.1 hypothetical protein ASG44_07745 [Methylophilus sp. Leaf459]